MKKLSIILLTVICLGKITAQTEWKSSDFDTYAANHKIIAILPFYVTEQNTSQKGNNNDNPSTVNPAKGYEMQQVFAERIAAVPEGKKWTITVQVQDVSETNRLLENAGITYENIPNTSKKELAKILGVDAVYLTEINSTVTSSGGDAAAAAIFGGTTADGTVDFNAKVVDGASGTLIYKAKQVMTTSIFINKDKMKEWFTNGLLGWFPYYQKVKKK